MQKKSNKKHPKHMTTDEAMKHLFHPHVVKHMKSRIERSQELRERSAALQHESRDLRKKKHG